jgi:TnpA family transposase
LRYIRRHYVTVESARQVARVIANATFATRQSWLWGEGSTAVALGDAGVGESAVLVGP